MIILLGDGSAMGPGLSVATGQGAKAMPVGPGAQKAQFFVGADLDLAKASLSPGRARSPLRANVRPHERNSNHVRGAHWTERPA
jgi:hypothetical protein